MQPAVFLQYCTLLVGTSSCMQRMAAPALAGRTMQCAVPCRAPPPPHTHTEPSAPATRSPPFVTLLGYENGSSASIIGDFKGLIAPDGELVSGGCGLLLAACLHMCAHLFIYCYICPAKKPV